MMCIVQTSATNWDFSMRLNRFLSFIPATLCIDLNLKIIFFGDNISILANLLSTNVFQETWKIGNMCQHPWDIGGKMEPLFHKCSYIQPLCELVHAICPHTESAAHDVIHEEYHQLNTFSWAIFESTLLSFPKNVDL